MKKILLVFGLAIAGLAANAQSEFKPTKGDVTTEFGLSGGILNSNFNLNETGGTLLRFRYFTQEKMAVRLGFNLSSDSETANAYGANNATGDVKRSQTNLMINLGVEKHFTGTERLSPYVGGDVLFAYGTQNRSYNNSNNNINNPTYVANVAGEVSGPGSLGIGLRGVAGADYYFAKKVYLGVEGGFGFLYQNQGKTTTKTTVGGNTTTTTTESAGNSFTIKPSVITGVRIGFVF